ncbi:SgcJ/EcaC family oxidoreductase [Planobispora siamensis]|uniref:DUF4440 domain-containing protein n=1 Tax=Planobispora siamensis TaxID=936338 RepID=A0A8J3SPB1_9ACTN|nr:SgcJ/EcaC family oxidoreductase [Planobispora siamensis]GIH93238.1 hypothetical protein Psi01_38680 [Planobispora siamensis]
MSEIFDEVGVRDLYHRLLDSWRRNDAEEYAALFVEDGMMVGFDGSQVAAAEILDHLSAIFGDHPVATYVAKVRRVRPLGADHAMVQAIVGMVPPGADDLRPEVNAFQTLVAERRGGTWQIVMFQNTPAQYHGRPDLAERHTAEIREVLRAGTDGGPV